MHRARHAMRVHPLRSKGVVVGIPVAAAVAFGAHSVLGVTPLSDQQEVAAPAPGVDAPSAPAPGAMAPLQSYGLATAPPPATLDLLSAPAEHAAPAEPRAAVASTPSTTTTRIAGPRASAPTETVPITRATAPSMMTFSPSGQPGPAAQAPAQQAPAQQDAGQQETARQAPAPQDAGQQDAADQGDAEQDAAEQDDDGGSSSGGSLLGIDLGAAKVSVLSFGR